MLPPLTCDRLLELISLATDADPDQPSVFSHTLTHRQALILLACELEEYPEAAVPSRSLQANILRECFRATAVRS